MGAVADAEVVVEVAVTIRRQQPVPHPQVVHHQTTVQGPLQVRGTRVPNTRISQPVIGPDAPCITAGAGLLIFVPNLEHVRGKMCLLPNLPNETSTNSSFQTNLKTLLTRCYTKKKCRK